MIKLDKNIFEGLLKKNTILVSGLITAPIIISTTTFKIGVFLACSFSVIIFLTVIIASFIPKKVTYAFRIILYTLIASLVYVPLFLFSKHFFLDELTSLGIYFPLLVVNSIIITQGESQNFKDNKIKLSLVTFFYIIGADIVILLFAAAREMISYGTFNGNMVGISLVNESVGKPFGGFILLGIILAIYKFIMNFIISLREKKKINENEELGAKV